jgi:hypothetical protein
MILSSKVHHARNGRPALKYRLLPRKMQRAIDVLHEVLFYKNIFGAPEILRHLMATASV